MHTIHWPSFIKYIQRYLKQGASIPLQNILDHTLQRLCKIIKVNSELSQLIFQVKWGADGSSGFQKFHQKPDPNFDQLSESDEGTMFVISMVPLILKAVNADGNEEVIWRNPQPSSYRWCRPIKIVYKKETIELVRKEIDDIQRQISELEPGSINGVLVKYELFLTMLDGKCINSLTGFGTQTCYICGAKPKEMNDLDAVKKRIVTGENLMYGLTPLHLWIRFLECVLHIGYKLNYQKARKTKNTSIEECEEMEARKKMIQQKLYEELGIRVDHVEQGKGKSNTGNTGRRFFKNYEISARITGFDEDLLRRFGVILTVLGSGYQIDANAFESYAMDTAKRYMEFYKWNFMPVALHKVLIHGADIIRHTQLPTGLHARVNSSNLLGGNLGGNVNVGDDTKMTAETCPGVPPSTATPDAVEMVKLGAAQGQPQHQPQPQHNCADDMFHAQYSYDPEYARMEAWLDEHPDFTHDYFIRKATRQVVDAWLVSHAASNSMNPPNSSQDLTSPTYAGGNYAQAKPSSGATTPVRKISAHEFERGGLLKPIVTTIDGYPTFLSVSPTREAPSECTSTQTTPAQTRPRRRSRNELKHLDEKELIFELVKDICNELDVRSLCHKILQNVSTLLRADRCSLFLVQGDRYPSADAVKCRSSARVRRPAFAAATAHPAADDLLLATTTTLSMAAAADRIQPVGCLSMEESPPTLLAVAETGCGAPLSISSPSTGSVIVGSPIGSTNTGSVEHLPLRETFSTSSTYLRTPNNGSHGCHSKCLVSKLFDVCSQSTLQEMEKKKEIRIPWGTGIVGYVAQSGESVNIPDAYKDERFNHDIDARTGYKTKSLLCMPIKDCNGEVIGVAQVINKKGDGCFTVNDEKIFASYLQFCGIGLRNAQLYEKSQLEVKRNQVLLDLARMIFEEQSTIEHMVFRILTHTQSLIQCQRVQVLLLHKASKGSFSRVFDFEANDLKGEDSDERTSPFESRFPINVGITGYVATTGETVNIPNAYEDDRFDPKVDDDASFRHRTILCMAIKNSSGQIIGVIQLVNKFDDLPFTKNDENFVEAFAIFCGMGIHNTHMYEKAVIAMAKQRVTLELLSYHASATLEDAIRLKSMRIPSAAKLRLHDFSFDDCELDDDETLKACLRMFLDLAFIERFHIDYEVLCRWLLSVKKNYRNVTYHNWRHAFNVAQTMFAIITSTQWWKIFGEIECLGLMIACLCHDLDHRGTNNSFQIKASSPLAQLYSTSTMEHHHFDQCIMILNSQGNQILSNVSPDEYSRIVKVLEDAILSTDLAVYFRKRGDFLHLVENESYQWHNDEHRTLLRGMTMTVCDLAAITKPWPIEKRVAELVTREFFEQGDIERNKFNITPIDIMNREKENELPMMQVGFIDSICLPIYQAFASLSDKLEPLVDGVKKNREQWMKVAEEGYQINHIPYESNDDDSQ